MLLKIGDLAKRIGLTVRTLHHYDAIGLVKPSCRSDAGYRLYDRNDIARLHRIQALRGLGLSLAEIGSMLDGDGTELRTVIRQQITSLERQLEQAAELRDRLAELDAQLANEAEPDVDEWLSTLGMMATYHKYFTPEELEALKQRKDNGKLNAQWPGLVAEIRTLIDRNIPPSSPEAKALTQRWLALQKQTMGDDPRFFVKLTTMHRTEFSVQALTGVDGALLDFIFLSALEIRCDLFAKYVTPEELQTYRSNFPKTMHQWMGLFAEVRQLMEQGIAPGQPAAQPLFAKWMALFQATWGNNPATRLKVRAAHRSDPRLLSGSGLNNPAMQAYVDMGIAQLAANSKSNA